MGTYEHLQKWCVLPSVLSSVTYGAAKRQETCAAAAAALNSQMPRSPSAASPPLLFQAGGRRTDHHLGHRGLQEEARPTYLPL